MPKTQNKGGAVALGLSSAESARSCLECCASFYITVKCFYCVIFGT